MVQWTDHWKKYSKNMGAAVFFLTSILYVHVFFPEILNFLLCFPSSNPF